jgi:hypothetical protein
MLIMPRVPTLEVLMKTTTQLNGRHSETGSIHNALALQGIKAPHTGKPYSEALLLGISGGIAFGYFTFEYKGYLPHVALLTRNTFGWVSHRIFSRRIKQRRQRKMYSTRWRADCIPSCGQTISACLTTLFPLTSPCGG